MKYHPITPLGQNEAVKTLGLKTTPIGNMSNQHQEILDTCEEWINKVRNGYLPRQSVWTDFWCQLWCSIRWDMGTFQFTEFELKEILQPTLYKLLPFIWVNRHITKEWQTLPVECLGLGVPDLPVEQPIQQLNTMMQNFSEKTPLGTYLQATYEQLVLEIGIEPNILQEPFSKFGFLATKSWIKSAWKGADAHGARFTIQDYRELLLRQINNKYLVQLFTDIGYNSNSLVILNRVRLFLQVYCLSDIIMPGGTHVSKRYIQATGPNRDEKSTYDKWPIEHPTRQNKMLWR